MQTIIVSKPTDLTENNANVITALKRFTEELVANGGTIRGRCLDDVPEEKHFHTCEKCGGWWDARDLAGMLAHITDDPCPPNPVRSN